MRVPKRFLCHIFLTDQAHNSFSLSIKNYPRPTRNRKLHLCVIDGFIDPLDRRGTTNAISCTVDATSFSRQDCSPS